MTSAYYKDSLEHILAELERIDALIRLHVLRARQLHDQDSEFQGLYISEKEVDELMIGSAGMPRWSNSAGPRAPVEVQSVIDRLKSDIDGRRAESDRRRIPLRLEKIKQLFGLTSYEIDALLICLAPEIDLRYERLFAYLQDDVTKKRPSVDLVLNLLSDSFGAKLASRPTFVESAPLSKFHLIRTFEDPSHQNPPWLSRYLKVSDRVIDFLFEHNTTTVSLQPFVRKITPQFRLEHLILPERVMCLLGPLIEKISARKSFVILYFQGPYGTGKRSTAEAICKAMDKNLLLIDLETMTGLEIAEFELALNRIERERRLLDTLLYWDGFDHLLTEEKKAHLAWYLRFLETDHQAHIMGGNSAWEPSGALLNQTFLRIKLTGPGHAGRHQLWEKLLGDAFGLAKDVDLSDISNKFRFSGGQIRDAAKTARNLALRRDPNSVQLERADLYQACQLQSNRQLSKLAQKITPQYQWDDIILPVDRLQQLREIANYIKYRSLVYDEWGFDRKLSLGKGLNALFSGPSGTGKTMAAEIMANELELDLYKIDLSSVVSKYIGETEKNLNRIFKEAATSNAILFFDEADALFGKRSEVRDAHDRYANIEISYLLQKMEEYEGVVILSTNLRKNMDNAFVRRMHFSVDFPLPTEKYRLRIWESIWPKETPRSPNLDFNFMARQFEISGGNIRNVALATSFLAADDGKVVTMQHMLNATRREYQKMGKVVAEKEFGQYARVMGIKQVKV